MANYGYKGWIKLWRKEMPMNPLYFEEPFTKWQAWVDLRMLADDKNTVKTSLEALKNRWLWGSTTKVRNYLKTVSNMGLVTVRSTANKGTQILINTDFMSDNSRTKNTVKNTVSNTVSKIEEDTSKEVGMASLEVSQPTTESKEQAYTALNNEVSDEYE